MNNKIKLLDEITISKIAAGEIIERPASIVKELIENSIDAGAENIVVEIKNGGKSYIRVTDDGMGINKDEIELAFLRHSTSKISSIEDLNNIYSLGFRGEALASISIVGKIETITKTKDEMNGIQVAIEDGEIIDKNSIGCPKGTTMIVRDLFYNIPVRKNFLKNDVTESNYVADIVYNLALGNPNISFKFIKDNKLVLKTPGNNDLKSNIYSVLGKDFVNSLLRVVYKDDFLSIDGYVSNNNFYRGNRNHQYLFVNKRCIKDNNITKAVEECYKSLIPINKYPIYVLFIEINPQFIDVNIHPTKQEIKFKNDIQVNDIIKSIVCKKLIEKVSVPNVYFNKNNDSIQIKSFIDRPKIDIIPKDKYIDIHDETEKVIEENIEDIEEKVQEKFDRVEENFTNKERIFEKNCENNYNEDIRYVLKNMKIVGVIFSTYILGEDLQNNNFYMIDQHAAHERVMYEKYKKEYESEKVVVQKLLAPEIVRLTNGEVSLIKENVQLFEKLGFEIDEFGINTIAIRGVPLIFGKPNSKELLLDILDSIKYNLNNSYEVKLEKIMKIACTNAIKGGDRIYSVEIRSLLNQLSETENPYTCPHGRPVIVKVSKTEIEKKFKRII